jgi:hypothetical protein
MRERVTRRPPLWLTVGALLAFTLTTAPCAAQSAPASGDKHEAAVRRLIELMGVRSQGRIRLDQLFEEYKSEFPSVPSTVWEEIRRQLAAENFARLQAAIYKKHFSLPEIEGLEAFFKSALGRRYLEEQPGLTLDALAASRDFDRRLAERLERTLEQKGYKAAAAAPAVWTAPASPDPQQILREAVDDAAARRYDVALEKQLWFHNNAVRYNRGLTGVRTSFALGYWRQLADAYPPAMDALKRTRDDAWSATLSGADTTLAVPSFRDFAALNRTLGEEARTANAFAQLDREKPEIAERVAIAARPALIRAKQFELCAKYVDADLWRTLLTAYQLARSSPDTGGLGSEAESFRDHRFTNDVATLVALLVVSGRKEDAERVAGEAEREKGDAEFVAAIDKALLGNVPAPWP